jgi:DNA-binding transcriptional LysR family regulator
MIDRSNALYRRDRSRISMDVRQLEYFVAVAEELSFTKASRRMHVVQSGVSSAIQSLERELAAPLFERDRHRVALTDAGQALLPEARATLAAAQAAIDAVAQAQAGLRGTLTVGTMVSIGTVDVAGLLGRFHTTHPRVAVHLRHAPAGSAGLAAQVIAGELDLALVALPGPAPAGLLLQPLTEEPLILIAARRHPLAGRRGVSLGQLTGEDFVDFPPGWGNRSVADRAFAAAGLDRRVPFEVTEFPSAASLVRNGLGIAFIPQSAADLTGLGVIGLDGPALRWRVSLATPTTRRLSAAARAFAAELLP